jgi:hypothetical protein
MTRAVNFKGLEVLANGVVSMRSLELAHQVPTKPEMPERRSFSASGSAVSLTLSKAFTLITLVHGGKHMPVEKYRD